MPPELWIYVVLATAAFTLAIAATFHQLARLNQKVDAMTTEFDTALQGWVDYANELKAERDEYAGALKSALATNAELIATDAATDTAQAEALQAELTRKLEDALAAVENDEPKKPDTYGPGKTTDKPAVPYEIPQAQPYPVPNPVPTAVPQGIPHPLGEGKLSKKDEDTADGSHLPAAGKGDAADFGAVTVVEGDKPDPLKGNDKPTRQSK